MSAGKHHPSSSWLPSFFSFYLQFNLIQFQFIQFNSVQCSAMHLLAVEFHSIQFTCCPYQLEKRVVRHPPRRRRRRKTQERLGNLPSLAITTSRVRVYTKKSERKEEKREREREEWRLHSFIHSTNFFFLHKGRPFDDAVRELWNQLLQPGFFKRRHLPESHDLLHAARPQSHLAVEQSFDP